ncbi:hypothetical protein AXFE_05880 [Acidithrix ferrooxidans]|uniref:Uncharacterized protein n=1 Tax=Acidithrix ferrooxidans TaxID=1280514 RepID=A0A0D8HKP9_9ACTN|nr:hypothetical protein AXFE_05880 [Acidithrix ferrooxidans]
MSREVHVRFWESQGVRFPLATHLDKGHRRELIYQFIDIRKADFPINVLCRVLAVSRLCLLPLVGEEEVPRRAT